jgi:hypothetical protein
VSGMTATHLADVLRGTTTDEYGDEQDVDTVIAADVEVSIIEGRKGQQVYTQQAELLRKPIEGRTTATRVFTGRARPGTDIRTGDRLRARRVRDQGVASIYLVEATFGSGGSPFGLPDLRMELRLIDT